MTNYQRLREIVEHSKQHCPGPWKARWDYDYGVTYIEDANGKNIYTYDNQDYLVSIDPDTLFELIEKAEIYDDLCDS